RSKRSLFLPTRQGKTPKGQGQVLSSPVASNEASALLPVGRPGGGMARYDNAVCWDEYLLWRDGGKGVGRPREDGRPAMSAWNGRCVLRRWRGELRRGWGRLCPWVGRHTERAGVYLGWFRPASRVGACRNLRQGSGVHTHRQVVAGPMCRGIVMCTAINAMLRQPALLLQFAGPSLRRAVTAPS